MKKRRFLIPSLLAAGFSADDASASLSAEPAVDVGPPDALIDILRLEHEYNLAAHRSHSSHGSHRSHRSGSGGSAVPGYSPPSRNQRSTPPSSVLPRSPSTAPRKVLPGHTGTFQNIVRRVQAGLYARGFFTGAIDGLIGPKTKAAIIRFQQDNGLPVTGTITSEVLNALQITAK